MIVNGKKYELEDLIQTIDKDSHKIQKIGTFFLTNEEIRILERNFIDYKSATSLKDLMLKIQMVLDDESIDPDDLNELDYVLEQISERDYYANTKY